MKFTLTSWTPATIQELMDNEGYFAGNMAQDWEITVKISHRVTNGTRVYYEWCGVKMGQFWVTPTDCVINDQESDYLEFGDSIEFSLPIYRLKDVRLLACCLDTVIYITLL